MYNIVFINVLFRYSTLFTYTSNNILLTNGRTFTVFLRPDGPMQVLDCPVAVWPVISKCKGCYALLTAINSPNWHQIQSGKMWEKSQNRTLPSVLRGLQGKKGKFDWVLNLKYFIRVATFRWPTQELLWPPWGVIWPTLRTAENRWTRRRMKRLKKTNWNSFRCQQECLSVGSLRGRKAKV